MMIEEAKELYWNYCLENNQYWGYGVTLKRLKKVKPFVWADKNLWDNILKSHSGLKYSPGVLKEIKPEVYEHMIGNLTGMIYEHLIEQKIIKIK